MRIRATLPKTIIVNVRLPYNSYVFIRQVSYKNMAQNTRDVQHLASNSSNNARRVRKIDNPYANFNPHAFYNAQQQYPLQMSPGQFGSFQQPNSRPYTTFQQQTINSFFNSNNVHEFEATDEPEFGEPIGTTCRRWENTKFGDSLEIQSGDQKQGLVFKLMSYNILAQCIADTLPHLYRHHNKNCLGWLNRRRLLIEEIKRHDSDILCFQEVQKSHMKDFFNIVLGEIGYVGIFKKRTNENLDGCAIYYKRDVFKLIEWTQVEYRQDKVVQTDVLNRDNVAIIAKLAPLANHNAAFIIATTHLLYNPKRTDVRVAQMQVCLTEIERFAYKKGGEYWPIIVTGDLNSIHNSATIEFISKATLNYAPLTKSSLMKPVNEGMKITGHKFIPHEIGVTDKCQHLQLLAIRDTNELITRETEMLLIQINHGSRPYNGINNNYDKTLFYTGHLSHKFALKSVYAIDDTCGTTMQNKWITVDYIFYSGKRDGREDKLKLISRYSLPKKEKLHNVFIPNRYLGSDHLSLIAQFKLEF